MGLGRERPLCDYLPALSANVKSHGSNWNRGGRTVHWEFCHVDDLFLVPLSAEMGKSLSLPSSLPA